MEESDNGERILDGKVAYMWTTCSPRKSFFRLSDMRLHLITWNGNKLQHGSAVFIDPGDHSKSYVSLSGRAHIYVRGPKKGKIYIGTKREDAKKCRDSFRWKRVDSKTYGSLLSTGVNRTSVWVPDIRCRFLSIKDILMRKDKAEDNCRYTYDGSFYAPYKDVKSGGVLVVEKRWCRDLLNVWNIVDKSLFISHCKTNNWRIFS